VGRLEQLGLWFHLGLAAALGFFVYQQWLIRHRERMPCFQAFLNNHYAELAVLIGIIGHYASV